jgi:flagellar protein FlaJ
LKLEILRQRFLKKKTEDTKKKKVAESVVMGSETVKIGLFGGFLSRFKRSDNKKAKLDAAKEKILADAANSAQKQKATTKAVWDNNSGFSGNVVKRITKLFPLLPENLKKANLAYSPEVFVRRTMISAMYMSLGMLMILFFLTAKAGYFSYALLFFPVVYISMFLYFLHLPDVKISKINKEINKEIVFAGRFLVVEIESGVTLYDAMRNLSANYPYVGAYFREIVNKINIGTPIESAVTETLEVCPSESLMKILWQVSNSLKTGSNLTEPLKNVIETLIKEQQIMVNEYAKKLNPLAMFYMLIAIIIPSLGVTMITIVSIFAGLKLNLTVMLGLALMNAFMQFMFVAMINSIRPPVEL